MKAHKPFRLDRDNAKMLGVCAGIADHFQIDVTLVRVGMAISAFMTFPIVLIGYFVVAGVADADGRRPERTPAVPAPQAASAEATRQRLRDLDARLQAIESDIVDSRHSKLAQEIDALR